MRRAAFIGVFLLAACAVSPQPNPPALDQARAAYSAAQADSEVLRHAASELDVAARTLAEAENSKSAEETTHRAYLAEQRARIARELGHARANERNALEARLKEAEEARDRALARAKEIEQERDLNDRLAAQVRRLQAQVAELQARETERGWILTLGSDLLFDLGQATLKPGGRRALANLARFMREHPERKIVIEGFTDNSGSPQANQRLSQRRAEAVREALVREHIEPTRILARGLGASYPVATNDDRAGRQLNRRVEILLGDTETRAATGAGAGSTSGASRAR
jgi:outer membrane protein OmpA-like peptidoglycan-associated protein